jgi:hypothetical protein
MTLSTANSSTTTNQKRDSWWGGKPVRQGERTCGTTYPHDSFMVKGVSSARRRGRSRCGPGMSQWQLPHWGWGESLAPRWSFMRCRWTSTAVSCRRRVAGAGPLGRRLKTESPGLAEGPSAITGKAVGHVSRCPSPSQAARMAADGSSGCGRSRPACPGVKEQPGKTGCLASGDRGHIPVAQSRRATSCLRLDFTCGRQKRGLDAETASVRDDAKVGVAGGCTP